MKNLVVVCLFVLVLMSLASGAGAAPDAFALADRVGEPNARSFFLFSTSAGNYTIRQDGMGEVSSPKGMRRVFNLKLGGKGRLERVYFLEHEGDLLLLYEVSDKVSEWAYLVRMEQKKRKARWLTPLSGPAVGPPIIKGDLVVFGEEGQEGRSIEINKTDGRVLRIE